MSIKPGKLYKIKKGYPSSGQPPWWGLEKGKIILVVDTSLLSKSGFQGPVFTVKILLPNEKFKFLCCNIGEWNNCFERVINEEQ